MWQPDSDLCAAEQARQKERHRARNAAIDTSVMYLTVKSLMRMSGKAAWFVHKEIKKGLLVPIRRGKGPGMTLIHPDEGRRWLLDLARREEEKEERKRAKAAQA